MQNNISTLICLSNDGNTVHRCLQNKAPVYLVDFCTPVSDIPSQRHLRSVTVHHLTVLCYRLSTFGHWAFSVAGSDGLELATGQSL